MRGIGKLVVGFSLFVVAACTLTPPAPPADIEITFQHRQPIVLQIAAMEVLDRYQPTLSFPHVEHLHRLTPGSVVRRWAAERIEAVGTRGLATLTVYEAAVIEEPLETTQGLAGLFNDEPDLQFVGVIRATFDHVDIGPPARSHSVEIVARASIEVLESATLNERDIAYFHVVEKLAEEFDRALTEEIEASLGDLIIR